VSERGWRRGRLGCYPQACDEGGSVLEITANLHVMVVVVKVRARGKSLGSRKSGNPNRLDGRGGKKCEPGASH
jgi:hypothetical protein